jgi:hypothetical protein
MMSLTTQTLLGEIIHGLPFGNYDGSSLDFVGEPQPAANYYRGRSALQTVTYVLQEFVGNIFIEATLDTDPATATWVAVDQLLADQSTPITGTYSANLTGNYTWLRVRVTDFTDNIIKSITVTY